jgi:hypothetical protein
MFESEAIAHCEKLLIELGMDRIWHPVLVRFGENTLKKFNQRSDGDPRLEDDDIFLSISGSCGTLMKAMWVRPS